MIKSNYSDKLAGALKQARPRLASTHKLEFKNVFGAVAGYVNSKIFITCGKFGVALRLPHKTLANVLKEKGVKRLKYFPKGHIKKEYAVLPRRLLDDRRQFKNLVNKSIKFVSEL